MRKCKLAVVYAILLLGIACSPRVSPVYEERESPRYSFQAFLSGIKAFPYDMPDDRRKKIVAAFPGLSPGMNEDQVKSLLGDPDAELLNYSISQGQRYYLGSAWMYYLHREEITYANTERDQTIAVNFDSKGFVNYAIPPSQSGMKRIGRP